MIDRLEIWRGQRVTVHTLDTGDVTGTLGEITYDINGAPISLEVRNPDDMPTHTVAIPWAAIAGLYPLPQNTEDTEE